MGLLLESGRALFGRESLPVISTRSVQTALLVRDGQTAVLGGLAEAQRERGSGGIPVLSSIPVIGGIFGSRSRADRNTELFIFLTPRIVRDDPELEATTRDVQQNGGEPGKAVRRTPPVILPRPGKERPPAAPAPAQPPRPVVQPGVAVPRPQPNR